MDDGGDSPRGATKTETPPARLWPCRATVVCGDSHSLAIAACGELYAWGKAYAGRCGIPDIAGLPTDDDVPYQPIPRHVVSGGFGERRVVAVAGGRWHNLAVGEHGELYAWGAADGGRCGFTDTAGMPRDEDNWPYQPVPTPVSGDWFSRKRISAIACGENHSLVATEDGELFAWGSLHFGRCGFGDILGLASPPLPLDDEDHPYQPVPKRVVAGGMDKHRVNFVACGTYHSAAVTVAGELFTWGSAVGGRCGYASIEGLPADADGNCWQPSPRQVVDGALAGRPVSAVACSDGHNFAVSTSGELCAWGSADAGRCGLGSVEELPMGPDGPIQPVPALVGCAGQKVKMVAVGSWHTLAVTEGYALYAWGATRAGRCGFAETHGLPVDENGPFQPVPRQVRDGGLRGRRVALAACGSWHSLAATSDGELFAWGVALMSRCGFPTTNMPVDDLCPFQPVPMAVAAMPKVSLGFAAPQGQLRRGCEAVCADLRQLLNDGGHADVCFEVDGQELRAHVAILAARCDHFRRMFRSGMAECRAVAADAGGGEAGRGGSASDSFDGAPLRRVVITDCGATAFKQLLVWLYAGSLDAGLETGDLAGLLSLADVYRVPGLGVHCERLLVGHINIESVICLLEVALATRAADLEEACLAFIVRHPAEVRRHQSYQLCKHMDVVRKVAEAWASELETATAEKAVANRAARQDYQRADVSLQL